MSELVIVRKKRCEGCLYSPGAIVANAEQARRLIVQEPGTRFHCHCHYRERNADGEKVFCRGYYDAHRERFAGVAVRFTKKMGKFWQEFKKYRPGQTWFEMK